MKKVHSRMYIIEFGKDAKGMISEELKTIIDKLNDQGKMAFLEGATEEQIAQFEKDHEIILPKKYKEWLQYSDHPRYSLGDTP